MDKLLTFDEAIENSKNCDKRHLLLGNGFSIACREEIFKYTSLFEQADIANIPRLDEVFAISNTSDFEQTLKMLEDVSNIVRLYSSKFEEIVHQITHDIEKIKNILISTIADNHPSRPNQIDDSEFWHCRYFLNRFNGNIYSLNYDLLLYWTRTHEINCDEKIELKFGDGFRKRGDKLIWIAEIKDDAPLIHHLHGALHLYNAGSNIHKFSWEDTKIPLLEQVREAIENNNLPLFVAEGKSDQKLAKIVRNQYLYNSYSDFSAKMKQENDALFIYGCSLAENDRHIFREIEKGTITKLYVGLYGDPNCSEYQKVKETASNLGKNRTNSFHLDVIFFDAESAKIWRP